MSTPFETYKMMKILAHDENSYTFITKDTNITSSMSSDDVHMKAGEH
jgi:hypothetical protein